MKVRTRTAFQRIFAGFACVLLLTWQLALPALALTQEEMAAMPTVTVYYQTAADASPMPAVATPTGDSQNKAYWVRLPGEAFGFPVTLSVAPNPATNYTFTPADGTPVMTDPATVDFGGASTLITAYQDGVEKETYRLYISSVEMPIVVAPATVPVYYVDADNPGNVLYSEQFTAYYDQENVVYANTGMVPQGYTLEGDVAQYVSVDQNGTASPGSITFSFRKAQEAVNGWLTIYYTDLGGNELASAQTRELEPGTHTITPDLGVVPQGYVLSSDGPQQVEVTVQNDGTTTPEAVTFEFAEAQTAPPADTDTPPPADTDTPPPADTDTPPPADTDAPAPADTDTPPPADTDTPAPADTPTPAITPVNRYAVTNKVANFRTLPDTASKKAFGDVAQGAYVWVYGVMDVTDSGGTTRTWAAIRYNGTDCYVWNSLIDTLAQEDSDAYNYAQASPVPGTETTPPPATDTPAPAHTDTPAPTETPAQVTGYYITTAEAQLVAGAGSDTILNVLPPDTPVFVEGQGYAGGYTWHATTDNGVPGYIRADVLRPMTEAEMQAYLATPTPTVAPTDSPTPEPTASTAPTDSPTPEPTVSTAPTDSPTPEPTVSTAPTNSPTPEPTASASASPSASPLVTPTQDPNMYMGYAVTTARTALRLSATLTDESVITMLDANTLLYINGQYTINSVLWSSSQVRLGSTASGIVQDSALRHITAAEADALIAAYDAAHATPTPTLTPTPSPTPAQLSGYYITLGQVPMRTVTSNYADVNLWLAPSTVVYVTGQVYNEGYGWHITSYGQTVGYVRADQLRKLSDTEVQQYLQTLATPTPTPAATAKPYDPYAASSYGYVSASTVNFRATPSTSGAKLKTLRQYAFALIIGSQVVNGQTWYNLNQAGTIGWVDGRYFKVLNLTELGVFLNSSEYLSGLTNNSGTGSSGSSGSTVNTGSSGSSGTASQGQVSSVEDWNLGVWQNPSTSLNASYEPFNPYATPTAPLVSASPTPSPTPTFVVGTMIPIPYEDEARETQTDNGWVGLTIGGVVLLGAAGGVYAYALNQNKKRRLAAHNAAMSRRNAQQGTTGAGAGTGAAPGSAANPYARRAVAAPPITGTTQRKDGTPGSQTGAYPRQNPYAGGTGTPYAGSGTNPYASGAASPYARPAQPNPYERPATGAEPYAAQPGADAEPNYTANPYTQASRPNPFANPTDGAAGDEEPANPTPRRASRASRHQQHDDGAES